MMLMMSRLAGKNGTISGSFRILVMMGFPPVSKQESPIYGKTYHRNKPGVLPCKTLPFSTT